MGGPRETPMASDELKIQRIRILKDRPPVPNLHPTNVHQVVLYPQETPVMKGKKNIMEPSGILKRRHLTILVH